MGRIDLSMREKKRLRLMALRLNQMGKCNIPIKNDQVSESKNESNEDYHVAEIYKDIDLYLAAKNGNLDDFERLLHRVSAAEQAPIGEILCRESPVGNTLLHLATKHGNKDIVSLIAKSSTTLYKKNIDGDTALHLAAKAGDESMVRTLVLIHEDLLKLDSEDDRETNKNILVRAKNERGNTALIEAINHGREIVAQYLIQEDPEILYYENNKDYFPLYLAAKLGFANCVASILEVSTDQERMIEQFMKKSPIKTAIKNKNRGVLEVMLNKNPNFVKLKDGKGRTPLHYAASLGNVNDVTYLLGKYAASATQRDRSGLLPIHVASIGGHVDIIIVLLQDFPEPAELLDKNGRNILHIAAKNGRCSVVNYILNNPNLEELINMKDREGNAPLHLATMDWHPKIVSDLTWDNRVNIKLVNDNGLTALDIAEDSMPHNRPLRQLLTWSALKTSGTPLSSSEKYRYTLKKECTPDYSKEKVNTLLLVATLIATITFAAGFTLPGGYNSSGANLGMATMLRDKGFHIFVLCDTIAMFFSIIVVLALIFAQLGEYCLIHTALRLALPLLGAALTFMSIAFTAGIFLVVNKLRWLGTSVLIIGFSSVSVLLILIVTLCFSYTPTNKIFRYLSYYPFYWLILATGSYTRE